MIDPLTGEWRPEQRGETNLMVFEGMSDFFDAIVEHRIMFFDPLINDFYETYRNQSGGCGCTKKKRRKMAKTRYLDLKHLQSSSQVRLKAELNTCGVRLMDEGEVVADWSEQEE